MKAGKKITVLFEDWTLRAEGAHKSYVFSEKVMIKGEPLEAREKITVLFEDSLP